MATNKIYSFAQQSLNILSDEEYEADQQRLIGHQPGIARAGLQNKASKQSNIMAAALAQFGVDSTGKEVNDSMPVQEIAEVISEAVKLTAAPDIATSNDINAGTAGKLVDAAGLKGVNLGAIVGEIRLLPFMATELPTGWYHANGDQYAIDSPIGHALQSLSIGYKTSWKIVESAGMINLPNMYHGDGRAYFPRAGSIPGVVQEDAIRNITGGIGVARRGPGGQDYAAGALYYAHHFNIGVKSGDGDNWGSRVAFDSSRIVPTSEENRPLNISFVPAIYLGV